MKKLLLFILSLAVFSGSAQADKSKQVLFSGQVTCATNTVTTQIAGWQPTRTEYLLYNSSSQNVWLNFSTATVNVPLSGTNSVLFNTGSAITDSGNNVFIGYLNCSSTGTATVPISVGDFGQ